MSQQRKPNLLDLHVNIPSAATLGAHLETSQVDAFVVLKDGDVVLDWRAPLVGDNECHHLFSVTKSITGLLCGALIGKGLISPSDLVVKYVPELSQSAFADATIRQLLDMEASYAFEEDYTPGPHLITYYKACGYLPAPPEEASLRKFLTRLARDPKEPLHGQRFRYLTPTTDVLCWVCEAASGERYAEALSKYLWIPIGAESNAYAPVDSEGTSRGSGGLSASPRDMARIGALIAQGGNGVVPSDFVSDLVRGGSTEHWARADDDFSKWLPGGCYRSCWYQPRVDPDCVMAVGIRGQLLYVDCARKVVIAKQASWDDPDPDDKRSDAENVCRAIARALVPSKM